MSAGAHRLGLAARSWEVSDGPHYDLSRPMVKQRIRSEAQCGNIICTMLAPPCGSFSSLQFLNERLRDASFPWGLPRLSARAEARVQEGNRTAFAALYYFRLCMRLSIPVCLEHPFRSWLWSCPEVQALLVRKGVESVIVDQCQFGSSFRKRTRLMFHGCDSLDVSSLNRLCRGGRVCNKTGRPHKPTFGTCPTGGKWSVQAGHYPPRFADVILRVLLESRRHAGSELSFGM